MIYCSSIACNLCDNVVAKMCITTYYTTHNNNNIEVQLPVLIRILISE